MTVGIEPRTAGLRFPLEESARVNKICDNIIAFELSNDP
jgi:hypothetical protein